MFTYKDGELFAEDVPLKAVAQSVGTPTFVYSTAHFAAQYEALKRAFEKIEPRICYAVKANSNQAVIAHFAGLGAGADVVSGGELTRALRAGVPADKIVYSGVGKTDEELTHAITSGVGQLNVESLGEIKAIAKIAQTLGRRQHIAIRVNPDVDAETHEKITTGTALNKFGIDVARVPEALELVQGLEGVRVTGLAVHIGSQITSAKPFRLAFASLVDLARGLREKGHEIASLDLGGGLGVSYDGSETISPEEYAEAVESTLGRADFTVTLEPGRYLTANGGILLASVIGNKRRADRRFLVLDAGMNDLHRPSLYDAYHRISPVEERGEEEETVTVDVVGPVCETGDTFARDRALAPQPAGSLVAIHSAGAYGAAMSSTYNSRPLAAEVLVKGGKFALIRRRQTIDELIAADMTPDWQRP